MNNFLSSFTLSFCLFVCRLTSPSPSLHQLPIEMSKPLSSTPAQIEDIAPNKTSHDYSAALGTIMNTIKDTTASNNQTLVSATNQGQRPTAMQKNVAPFLNKVYK
jgi:hypothetical protein